MTRADPEVEPEAEKAFRLLISETSVDTFSEIRPGPRTTGEKPRPTPYCLNSTVMRPLESWLTGTGNSPPARNLALSPEMAVTFGSARVRTRPTRSKAWIMALAWLTPVDPAVAAGTAVFQLE